MSRKRIIGVMVLLYFNAGVLGSAPCRAALGADAASIAAEQNALRGELALREAGVCQVGEISTPSGVRVREYVAGGSIFAVAWSGPAPPDLRLLLGAHHRDYSAALLKLQPLGLHRSLRLSTAGMIVELSGHLRAYNGRAYLPASVPHGMSAAEIR